jgi:hypothetical protein
MVMGVSDSLPRGNRGRIRPDARGRRVRGSRLRRIDLEGLEPRTLLATIPAAAATAPPVNLSSLMGNAGGLTTSENSTTVAIDPTNPSKIVAAWVDNDPSLGITGPPYAVQSVLEVVYTINGGQTWSVLFSEPGTRPGPNPILLDSPVAVARSFCRSSTSQETRQLHKPSPHRKRAVMLLIEFSTSGYRPMISRSIRR